MKTLIPPTPTIKWTDGKVKLIDQTKLPLDEVFIETDNYQEVCRAIYRLSIRGAPAIGVAGAYACVLAAYEINCKSLNDYKKSFSKISDEIISTRPTAVNLKWAVNHMKKKVANHNGSIENINEELLKLAHSIKEDDLYRCHTLAMNGSELIRDKSNLMTICNTGGLATSGIGTALGVIQYAHAMKKDLNIFVCETRPLLQGARLNTWELKKTKTPFSLITDSMAAMIMKNKNIDAVFVGADRIASNGDTANKIGTYSLASLAKFHQIPFYVAAPLSTIDYQITSGNDIPLEFRSPDEITSVKGIHFTNSDFKVETPAFDITPSELITGIITEKGIAKYPFTNSLKDHKNVK